MRERNYLHANDIYLKLAIGNSPWPIGVTQVGMSVVCSTEVFGWYGGWSWQLALAYRLYTGGCEGARIWAWPGQAWIE